MISSWKEISFSPFGLRTFKGLASLEDMPVPSLDPRLAMACQFAEAFLETC
jgi:hypothetical protein